ncbi:MAG: DUF4177 domain-containing protein [Clostridia bacterium]|nr:DUF4177 domain-containing protein [Clostridia bacterium]
MFEYKVEVCKVKIAEHKMNEMAKQGWRVVAVSPDIAAGYGVLITFERNLNP